MIILNEIETQALKEILQEELKEREEVKLLKLFHKEAKHLLNKMQGMQEYTITNNQEKELILLILEDYKNNNSALNLINEIERQ